ncbi:MAG: hypothetical protein H0X42_00175 [Solirubrobacterales bacterium]|nr:hypothetical protein [Solirubrobacterales bacterium]
MNRPRLNRLALLAALAALGILLFAATASAATIKLACGGTGSRNQDSLGTVLCAAAVGKPRTVTGTVRSDSGKAVAAKITVTFISWTPAGEGAFDLEPTSTRTITAKANGSFSLPVKTSSRIGLKFETVADEKLGVSATAVEAQVSRQLSTSVTKLGGGRVKITVKGTSEPVKIAVTDEYGYEISGGKTRSANKAGSAIFHLSGHGTFYYAYSAGKLGDLYWEGARPSFHL